MNGALAFLVWRSLRNRARVQVGRLRNIRYVLGLLFMVGYFALVLRPDRLLRAPRGDAFGSQAMISGTVTAFSAVVLLLVATMWWTFGSKITALAFSPAEAQLLVPAPLSRTRLILYKLARAQIPILFSALVLTVITARRGTSALPIPLRLLTYFVLFSTLLLHKLGATMTRAGGQPVDDLRGPRRWIIGAVAVGLVAAAIGYSAAAAWPHLLQGSEPGDMLTVVQAALSYGPLSWLSWPFRALLRPMSATSLAEWGATFPVALGVMLLHYPWILLSRAPFEEAAVAAGARRERIRAAIRARRKGGGRVDAFAILREVRDAERGRSSTRPLWVKLKPTGAPWVAVVWKNFIPTTRQLRWTTLAIAVIGVLAVAALIAWVQVDQGRPLEVAITTTRNILAAVFLGFAVISMLIGGLYARNDFRSDLPYLKSLRGWPLSSAQLVGAEIAAASLLLYIVQVAFLLLAWLLPTGPLVPPFAERTGILVLLLFVGAVLDVLGVSVRNAIALFFPGWVKLGGDGGGVEAIGYNVLGTIGAFLLLALLLLLPLTAAGVALYATVGIPTELSLAPVIAVLVFLALIVLELRWLFRWLGSVFEDIDAGELLEQA